MMFMESLISRVFSNSVNLHLCLPWVYHTSMCFLHYQIQIRNIAVELRKIIPFNSEISPKEELLMISIGYTLVPLSPMLFFVV